MVMAQDKDKNRDHDHRGMSATESTERDQRQQQTDQRHPTGPREHTGMRRRERDENHRHRGAPQGLDFWRDESMFGLAHPFERLERAFFSDFLSPLSPMRTGLSRMPGRMMDLALQFPRVDISDTGREIKVTAEVPGVQPDDIEIDIHDNHLHISGYTESEHEGGERQYRHERIYGEFSRVILLPEQVEENDVQAEYQDGVLTIHLPKRERSRNRVKVEKVDRKRKEEKTNSSKAD